MEKWLNEVSDSLAEAIERAEGENTPLQEIYTLAPLLYAEKYKMEDSSVLNEMLAEVKAQVAQDYSHDERSKDQYKFHYVSSYLYCFVVEERLEESEYDQIMEYVCINMDLFTDDYTGE